MSKLNAMMRGVHNFFLVTLTFTLVAMMPKCASAETIGINYGRVASPGNLPPPSDVVELLQSRAVKHIRIYDADHGVLTAFQSSGIKVTAMVTNGEVEGMAINQHAADDWVRNNVQPFASTIHRISVGNEWLATAGRDSGSRVLVLAMQNLHRSLTNAGLAIKVTTPHAFDVQGYPPSQGRFPDETSMSAILQFLQHTGSVFELNVYGFFAFRDTRSIDLDYALFNPGNARVVDDHDGKVVVYENLFDAMVDTCIAAMRKLGFDDVPVVVSETGWPAKGDGRGVGVENAKTYNNNLVKHVLGNHGTPLRPGVNIETYIFALFNENEKEPGIERNWGLYKPDKTPVYHVNLSV